MALPTDMIQDPTTGQMVTRASLQAKYDQMKASQTPVGTYLTSTDPNIPDYLKYRNTPTVATPGQPVISKTFTNDLAYDETNPEDYLMQLSAKVQATKKAPTQTELYNMYKAQNAMNKIKQTTNPLQAQLDAIQKQYDEARALETSSDNNALEAYKAKLEQEYMQKIADAETQGKKQKEASQNVYSFSGFGRSTAAGDKAAEIEQTTQRAISMLNAQKQLEIQLEEARLRGDDPESLKGLYASLEQTRKGVNDRQIESIKKTAEANKTAGASYIESINNFMKTAADSGIDIGDPKTILEYAKMARNADGTVNETFIKNLPEDVQAIIRSAAGSSGASPDAQTKNFGSATRPNWKQSFDGGKTWVNMTGVGSSSGGNSKGSVSAGTPAGVYNGSATDLINYNVKFKNQDQSNAFNYATRMIEASEIFNNLGDDISKLSKAEYIKQKALGKLPYGSSLQSNLIQQQEQAERNFVNAVLRKESGAAIADTEFESAKKQYLPQPGDTAETLEQKRRNRLTALKGISAATGNQPALKGAIDKVSQANTNVITEYQANKTYNVGDKVVRNGKTYILGADKKFRLSQ